MFAISDFEVAMINRLRVSPSQLHSGSWAYMNVFQLCIEQKSWKPSHELFFDIFYAAHTSQDDARGLRIDLFLPPCPFFQIFHQ